MVRTPHYLACPAVTCDYKFRVTEVLIGQHVTCPKCAMAFHLPDPNDPAGMAKYEAVVNEQRRERTSAERSAADSIELGAAPANNNSSGIMSGGQKAAELRRLDKLPQDIERPKFTLRARDNGTAVVCSVDGTFDPHEAMLLDAYLKACLQNYPKRLVVDMAGLKAAHSSAIGALVGCIDKGRSIACDVVFANMQANVRFVMDTLGLTEMTSIYDSVAEAVEGADT